MKKKIQKKKNAANKIEMYIDASVDKAKKEFSEESHRYMKVLSEEFQGRVSEMGKRFDDVDKRFDDVDRRFDGVDKKISGFGETLNSHTEMIGKLAIDVEIIKNNVEFLKGGLKKKVDYDEFLALEKRMSVLESKIK